MVANNAWKPRELLLAFVAILLVLFVQSAIPFVMVPTLGQAVWTTGFAQSLANGAWFDFYAHEFGIPKPAAIAFGLAGAWPASLLIRLGLQPADAYTCMVTAWLGVAMGCAYGITRRFGATRSVALTVATVWMTLPIIWAHAGYSMLSLGIALLPFYFLMALRLFLIGSAEPRVNPAAAAGYAAAAIIAVFMDGYTFMMFAVGASMLLAYVLLTRPDLRPVLARIAIPVHLGSFALAYLLFSAYIGKSNFEAHPLDFFRGWGLDLTFLAIPTKGILWLPDILGASSQRTAEHHFGDGSVWQTTFALPILVCALLAWRRARRRVPICTGILIVALFGFYMALGPSLKVDSTKPAESESGVDLRHISTMASEYALAPTGNAWISEHLPGFNVMRAAYRWSALGLFAAWLLIAIYLAQADRKSNGAWMGVLLGLVLLNLPHPLNNWHRGVDNRSMFRQIDQTLVNALRQHVRPNETVAFLPWRNDFFANYLAPRTGFRTFNIGGDKNLAAAQTAWPEGMLTSGDEFQASDAPAAVKMLVDGTADVIILPFVHMLWSPHIWPCVDETTARLTDETRAAARATRGFICPAVRQAQLQPALAALRASPYVDVVETPLFATIRLRSQFSGPAQRRALLDSIVAGSTYPMAMRRDFEQAPYVLREGWHELEAQHVWSKAAGRLTLPIPDDCAAAECAARLVFVVFGAGPERPVQVRFSSTEQDWQWSESITAQSSDAMSIDVPLGRPGRSLTLAFAVDEATSPERLMGSSDGRILGIALQRIELIGP